MPDESAQNPAGNNQQPKKIDLPIAGKIVSVKGGAGIGAKKEGQEIKLSFELPVKADAASQAAPEISSEIPSDINAADQTATDAKPENTNDQQTIPTDNKPTIEPSPATSATPSAPTNTTNPTTPSTKTPTTPDTAKDENNPGNNKPSLMDRAMEPGEKRVLKGDNWRDVLNDKISRDNNLTTGTNPPTGEKPQEKENTPEGQTPTQPVNEQNPEGKEPENQPPTSPAEQPTPAGNAPLTPEQQREAGQDLKKESLRQRAGNLKNNVANIPSNVKNKANNLKNNISNVAKDPKQAAKNFGNKLGDNVKTGAKNKGKEIANSLQTSGMRRRKLLKEANEISKQISELQGTVRGLKASRELRILKFFFPSLYNKIAGITEVAGDATQKIKVTKLESQVASLRTAKMSLETAQGAAAVLDAIVTTVRLAAGLIETVIGTIAVILLSPIIILVLTMVYFVTGGKFSKAFKELVLKINKILEPLEKTLGVERKKLNLMNKRKSKREEIATLETQEKQEKQEAQQTGQSGQPATQAAPTAGPAPAQPEQNKLST